MTHLIGDDQKDKASWLCPRSLRFRAGWRRHTRRINIGLNAALACLILFFAVDGNIFQSSQVDQIARNVLALVGAIYLSCVAVKLFGEIGRIGHAGAARDA